jgi:DNA-directed RNA polymerase subunit N (RpoN/RPB10)
MNFCYQFTGLVVKKTTQEELLGFMGITHYKPRRMLFQMEHQMKPMAIDLFDLLLQLSDFGVEVNGKTCPNA